MRSPHLLDPKSGYLFNVNDSPWNGAGESSLRKQDYPAYVETGRESARGLHAIRVLKGKKDFTLDSLITAAYDSYLPWFEKPLPALIKAWSNLPADSETKAALAGPIAVLRAWDLRWGRGLGGDFAGGLLGAGDSQGRQREQRFRRRVCRAQVPDDVALKALATASAKLTADFGSWQTPWGEINRYQRLTGDIVQRFDDAQPSTPVGFTSSTWGSLAAFGARPYTAEETGRETGTKKWYGTEGK